MSGQIPTRWPDVEAWFIGYVTPAKIAALDASLSGSVVRNQKPAAKKADGTPNPDGTPPYKQVIIAADYGQNITRLTRYVRVRMQAWVVKDQNVSDIGPAFRLANAAAFIAQQAPRDSNPIVSVEVDAGPSRVKDTQSGTGALTGIEYQAVTLLLEVHAL